MYRMTRQAFSSPARVADSRSPFVRLRELLADIAPGKPAISMAVGEPQHPIPDFVAPIIAAHVAEFGRYPMNRGLDPFVEAVATRSNGPLWGFSNDSRHATIFKELVREIDPEPGMLTAPVMHVMHAHVCRGDCDDVA